MDIRQKIIDQLKKLTSHSYLEILTRGNAAIWSALHAAPKEVLVPEEGGWLTFLHYPPKLKLNITKVKTNQAILDLKDLEEKSKTANILLYQNPGGYFAPQPIKEIYQICQKNNCLTIMDVSGSLGTKLCKGNYADILVGSFGRWKLIDAGVGGFISCKNKALFSQLKSTFKVLNEPAKLRIILDKINNLDERINFLLNKRKQILQDLKNFPFLHKNSLGFVLVAPYQTQKEKEKLIKYCQNNHLNYTECPRYIRINQKAISIEIKQLP